MTPKMRLAEMEFGEPFFDIVQGFAEMGYSRAETGRALEYNPEYFTRVVLSQIDPGGDIGWPGHNCDRVNQERYQTPEFQAAIARINAQNGDRRARRYCVGDRWLTVREIAEHSGASVSTIRYRIRHGQSGVDLLAPPMSPQARGHIGITARRRLNWAKSDEVSIARQLHQSGMSVAEIARKLERHYHTVYDWCAYRTRQGVRALREAA